MPSREKRRGGIGWIEPGKAMTDTRDWILVFIGFYVIFAALAAGHAFGFCRAGVFEPIG
jgi:hypothetical protein